MPSVPLTKITQLLRQRAETAASTGSYSAPIQELAAALSAKPMTGRYPEPEQAAEVVALLTPRELQSVLDELGPHRSATLARTLLRDAVDLRPGVSIPVARWPVAWTALIDQLASRPERLTGADWLELRQALPGRPAGTGLPLWLRGSVGQPGVAEATAFLHHPVGAVIQRLSPEAWASLLDTRLGPAELVHLVPHASDRQLPEVLARLTPPSYHEKWKQGPLLQAAGEHCDAGDLTLLAARITAIDGADLRSQAFRAFVSGQPSLDMVVFAHQLPADVLRELVSSIPQTDLQTMVADAQADLWRVALGAARADVVARHCHSAGLITLIANAVDAPPHADGMPARPADLVPGSRDSHMGDVLPRARAVAETFTDEWSDRPPLAGAPPGVAAVLRNILDPSAEALRRLSLPAPAYGLTL